MQTVFMPNNIRMYDMIVSKADLLIETDMPQCLLIFCAHVSAAQPVMKKWEAKDYSQQRSEVFYPAKELLEYCSKSFKSLKAEQSSLLGAK